MLMSMPARVYDPTAVPATAYRRVELSSSGNKVLADRKRVYNTGWVSERRLQQAKHTPMSKR